MTAQGTLRHVKNVPFPPEVLAKLRALVEREGNSFRKAAASIGTSQTLLEKAIYLGFARKDSVRRFTEIAEAL